MSPQKCIAPKITIRSISPKPRKIGTRNNQIKLDQFMKHVDTIEIFQKEIRLLKNTPREEFEVHLIVFLGIFKDTSYFGINTITYTHPWTYTQVSLGPSRFLHHTQFSGFLTTIPSDSPAHIPYKCGVKSGESTGILTMNDIQD